MSEVVLDASALLALLLGEPGGERVRAAIDGAAIAAVNLAEVVSFYAKQGAGRADIEAPLRPLPMRIVPLDEALAYAAGMLRPQISAQGLSLGDRCCLALARLEGRPAPTAEHRRSAVAQTVGVAVEVIRPPRP